MSPKFAAFAAWLTGVAFFGGIGGYPVVPQLLYLHDLSKSNRVTEGEIVETYPQIHSSKKARPPNNTHTHMRENSLNNFAI